MLEHLYKFLGIYNYKRIESIDMAKALAIIFVILGHILPKESVLKQYIYSFHMPMFFILTGIVLKHKENEKLLFFIKKQFIKILIPYIIFAMIFSNGTFKAFCWILYGNRTTLIFADTNSSLWFLPCLFLANIIVKIMIMLLKNNTSKLLIVSMFFMGIGFLLNNIDIKYGIPFELDNALIAVFFIIVGYFVKNNNKLFKKIINSWSCFIFLGLNIIFAFLNKIETGYVLMADGIYGNFIFFVLGALLGSVFWIKIADLIVEKIKYRKFLLFFGVNTLTIMCIHKFLIQVFDIINGVLKIGGAIEIIVELLFVLIMSALIIPIINKYVPNLVGKNENVTNL